MAAPAAAGPGVGFQYPPQPVSWTQRDLLLFAASIGATVDELHFLYELHPNFAAFPTYPIILPFKGTSSTVVDFYAASAARRATIPGVPDFDSRRVVDGERHMTFFRPLPTASGDAAFECRQQVLGIYDKGKPGTVLETQTDLVDAATGAAYARTVTSSFFVAQGGWGGPKGPKTPSFAPPDRAPEVVREHPIRLEAAHLYRLNGDYNPLHATPEPGAKMGFGGAIMHGLYSWNVAAHTLLQELGASDPGNLREFGARFASPVRPGDTLVLQFWRGERDREGFEDVRFVVQVKGGKVALSNGRAKVRVEEKGKVEGSKL